VDGVRDICSSKLIKEVQDCNLFELPELNSNWAKWSIINNRVLTAAFH